jgi:hypothetical protein
MDRTSRRRGSREATAGASTRSRLAESMIIGSLNAGIPSKRLSDEYTRTTARLAALAERIRDLEAAFSCGGTITLPAPVTCSSPNAGASASYARRVWTRRIGRKPMARCQPTPFGVGRKTYHDRRVPDGGRLLARDGALRASCLDLNGT